MTSRREPLAQLAASQVPTAHERLWAAVQKLRDSSGQVPRHVRHDAAKQNDTAEFAEHGI
jgi:hypothetical protein